MAKKTGIASDYLHGFSQKEQARLRQQARFLEHLVFEGVDFSGKHNVIEIGSGVGAQTEILLERFPHALVSCVDASAAQLAAAKKSLSSAARAKRVAFFEADAMKLPFADSSFDGAFICWLLEHVKNPVEILKELRRVLRTDARVFIREVLNATFYVHPYSPATMQYWFAFNDLQWNMQGDPFVGAKLANYLLAAGFQAVETEPATIHLDNRMPKKRSEFIDYWTELLLSGAPKLIAGKHVTAELVKEMTSELARLKTDPDAVFFYSFVRAQAAVY